MKISSTAFTDGGNIPEEFSKDGGNHRPPLYFEDVPAEAKTLALIVDDPDALRGTFTHWIAYNIPPKTRAIANGEAAVTMEQATNDFGQPAYGGPKPPSGEHRYFFKLYALDDQITLPRGASRLDMEEAILGHVIAEAQCVGRFAAHALAETH